MSRITRAALAAALITAALPAAADAATVEVQDSKTGPFAFHYRAAAGEVNDVRVAEAADGTITISDTAPIRIVGADRGECRLDGVGDAICDSDLGFHRFELGDRDDIVRYLAASRPVFGVDGGEGNDLIFAGVRRNGIGTLTIAGGPGTADKVTYASAAFPATVSLDDQANDGVRADVNNIKSDVEIVEGSALSDTITGSDTDERERFIGGAGNDTINGLGGSDVFHEGTAPNGADTFNGGSGIDLVDYSQRTAGVNVVLDLQRNDGAPGELDFVDPNVNDVFGGIGPDIITGSPTANTINGHAGTDTIVALGGNDRLIGGPGVDRLFGDAGDDVVEAADDTRDQVRCDIGNDVLFRDLLDTDATGCEVVNSVGTLELTPKALTVKAGAAAKLRLSWTHPKSWKQLRTVTLRLRLRDKVVGTLAIRPRAERITAAGAVHLVRRTSRLSHRGAKITARLALRLDPALAGKTLRAEVEATDTQSRRQIERDAGTVRVAR
jgi:hypothetical protein